MNLKSYLLACGVLENGTKKDIKAAKKKYRQIYQKQYQQDYQKRVIRKKIQFTKKEFKHIERLAKQHKQGIAPFLKSCIFGYLEQVFVVPDEEEVRQLELSIRRIGTNINQIARHTNREHRVGEETIKGIQQQIRGLEQRISTALRQPKTAVELFHDAAKDSPRAVQYLERLLTNYRQKVGQNE